MTPPDSPSPSSSSTTWQPDGLHGARLVRDQTVLAEYRDGTDMEPSASPRPYLHPVRSTAGTPLTDVRPADHVHHMGVSMALPVVDGTSFWGGRTYVRDQGSTLLDNHGRQQPLTTDLEGPHLVQHLVYLDEHGDPLLRERRQVTAVDLTEGAWALGWSSDLLATEKDLAFDSPATNGRVGAGYGGILWRLGTADSRQVLSVEGEGEDRAHGSTSPWVAFVQHRRTAAVTLVLAQTGTVLPWFLRATEYDGAGPAVAWDRTRTVAQGETLHLGLVGAVVDRVLDLEEAGALAEQAVAALPAAALPAAAVPSTHG